jgi:hypothetical protein
VSGIPGYELRVTSYELRITHYSPCPTTSFIFTSILSSPCSTGWGRVEKLVQRAQRLGQPALALTDHGTMHGVIPFFRAAKGAGIHP